MNDTTSGFATALSQLVQFLYPSSSPVSVSAPDSNGLRPRLMLTDSAFLAGLLHFQAENVTGSLNLAILFNVTIS